MFWWLKEILSSFKFILITSDKSFFQSKRVYEFLLPFLGALGPAALYLFLPEVFAPSLLKNFSSNVFQVMVFVVPFHLAALAALSTHQAAGLNEKLPGSEAKIKLWSNVDNGYFFHDITLRQYASLLFGYLCSIGIAYVLIYIFASILDFSALAGGNYVYLRNFLIFCSFFFMLHYVILTIYAVTFLFDKVNKIRSS